MKLSPEAQAILAKAHITCFSDIRFIIPNGVQVTKFEADELARFIIETKTSVGECAGASLMALIHMAGVEKLEGALESLINPDN